jgi:hypothetical protein
MPTPFEALWIVKESAYGTPKTTPAAGVDSIYIRLEAGNRFTLRPKRPIVQIPYGGGISTPDYPISDAYDLAGSLTTILTYSQALFLSSWMATPINAGQTSPWVTTEPAGDLASCSVYHMKARSDYTFNRKRYAGTKVKSWKLDVSAETRYAMLALDLVAQKHVGNAADASSDPLAAEFAAPTAASFPRDPLLYSHSTGGFLVAGSPYSDYASLGLSVENVLSAKRYETQFLSLCRYRGRKSVLNFKSLYKTSPDQRTLYEALTAQAVSLAFTSGANSVTFSYNGNNVRDGVEDDLDLAQLYEESTTIQNYIDGSTGNDLAITVV